MCKIKKSQLRSSYQAIRVDPIRGASSYVNTDQVFQEDNL